MEMTNPFSDENLFASGQHGSLVPGDYWHPRPKLCLLTLLEFYYWTRAPGRPITAVKRAEGIIMQLDLDPTDKSRN